MTDPVRRRTLRRRWVPPHRWEVRQLQAEIRRIDAVLADSDAPAHLLREYRNIRKCRQSGLNYLNDRARNETRSLIDIGYHPWLISTQGRAWWRKVLIATRTWQANQLTDGMVITVTEDYIVVQPEIACQPMLLIDMAAITGEDLDVMGHEIRRADEPDDDERPAAATETATHPDGDHATLGRDDCEQDPVDPGWLR